MDGPAVPTKLAMDVSTDGIVNLRFRYPGIDFLHVGQPRDDWIARNHPEVFEILPDGEVRFGDWNSVEEAAEVGLLQVQYAQLWADHLEANGCGYLDDC